MAKRGRPKKNPEEKPAKAKRLRAKVTIPGADKPVWLSAKTKSELKRKKEEIRLQYVDGMRMRNITFRNLVAEWFELCKKPNIRSASTLKNWLNALNRHVLPCFPEQQLARAVLRSDLQNCLNQTAGLSSTMSGYVRSILQHSFEYAVSERIVTTSPAVSLILPPAPSSEPRTALTRDEEAGILKAAQTYDYGLMLYLLYYLGLRRGEMLGLRWEDFDFKRKIVHIQRDVDFNATNTSSKSVIGELKNRAANRLVPIPDELMDILLPLRSLPHLYLVTDGKANEPLNANKYRTRWNKLMQCAGFLFLKESYTQKAKDREAAGQKPIAPNIAYDYDSPITAHRLRHHYITAKVEASERPEVIMAIVGHSDYSTTINIYTHVRDHIGECEPTLLSQTFKKYVATASI